MFSGKTTELVRRIRRHCLAKRQCVVIKYRGDTRYSEEKLSTHDLAMIPAISCQKLSEVDSKVQNADVIGIDEGQFYPDLLPFCESQANAGKIVIVSALDGTFERKRFNSVDDIIPLCESVVKLNAVCTVCGATAAFSKRIVDDTKLELVGGSDKYTAVCRKCYFAHSLQHKEESSKCEKEISSPIANPNSPSLDEPISFPSS